MPYDFDSIIDRGNTFAIKYDVATARKKPADSIKLWVADMDFPTAPCIQARLPILPTMVFSATAARTRDIMRRSKTGFAHATILPLKTNGL